MLQQEKAKLQIKKKMFYWFIFLIFIYIIAYTIFLLSAVIINTEIYDDIADKAVRNDAIVKWMAGKIISYFINCLMCLCFVMYIMLGRRRLKVGYIFITLWIVIWIGLVASTHVVAGSHDEPIRLSMGIVVSIAAGSIIIILLTMYHDLYRIRKNRRQEAYKIYKQKRKGNNVQRNTNSKSSI